MALSQQAQTASAVSASPLLTNGERLAARIKALPKGRLTTLQVIIGEDGEPLAWAVVESAKLEGLAGAFLSAETQSPRPPGVA